MNQGALHPGARNRGGGRSLWFHRAAATTDPEFLGWMFLFEAPSHGCRPLLTSIMVLNSTESESCSPITCDPVPKSVQFFSALKVGVTELYAWKVLNPVHNSNNVEATFDFVEATFDFVKRIVRLVTFHNVASTLLPVCTGLYTAFTH